MIVLNFQKLGKRFAYNPKLKRITYSMKEYIRSKYSYFEGEIEHCFICVYLITTNIHFYVNAEEKLENFLFLEHELVEHEEIQDRLHDAHYTFNINSEEREAFKNIDDTTIRYLLTDEEYENLKDENKIHLTEYIIYHKD